jgi:hypothetical protein
MNYFAHGLRFIDRPYFLAGTAVPDWLSVADRKVRMRQRRVVPVADASGTVAAEVAAGVLKHLEDDRWFHETPAFHETTAELTRMFRALLGPEDGFRPSFLGHISAELLLDGVLMAERPKLVDEYYRALAGVDADAIQQAVNSMAREVTDRLALFITLFEHEQFLRDYLEPNRLLFRLNQVMRRIKLNPLPDRTEDVLRAGWTLVERRVEGLLPPERFR